MKSFISLALLSILWKEPSENGISYRNLSWADFKAPVPKNEITVAARTTTELIFGYTEVGPVYSFSVKAYFLPFYSFARVKNDDVLRHEQVHFQIAHIMAVECMQKMEPLQQGDSSAFQQARKLFNDYNVDKELLNASFDRESDHGLNIAAEKTWEARISQRLNKLVHSEILSHGRNN
jgi:hypothetical protein